MQTAEIKFFEIEKNCFIFSLKFFTLNCVVFKWFTFVDVNNNIFFFFLFYFSEE